MPLTFAAPKHHYATYYILSIFKQKLTGSSSRFKKSIIMGKIPLLIINGSRGYFSTNIKQKINK
jgi:hypothetical protein